MSTQNSKRPVFTKVMLGYAPREVDGYIDRMNERYAAAIKDISRLKRRLEQLREELDRARLSLEREDAEKLRILFDEEKRRHAAALDAMLGVLADRTEPAISVEAAPADEFVPLDDDDAEDESRDVRTDEEFALDSSFAVDDAYTLDAAQEFADTELGEMRGKLNDAEKFTESGAESELFTPRADEATLDFDSDGGEYGPFELDAEFFGSDGGAREPFGEEASDADDDDEADAEAIDEEFSPEQGLVSDEVIVDPDTEAEAASDETPAKLAESLDFHTDTVVRDGESYDPMTLAHRATGARRPTYEDFMRPLGDGDAPRRD